jgi:hypothetical protein
MIGYSVEFEHLFLAYPPHGSGSVVRLLQERTAQYVGAADVPLWAREQRTYSAGIGRKISDLRFGDIRFADDTSVVQSILTWLESIHDMLRNLSVAEYIFTNGYVLPTDPDHISSYVLMQEQVVTNIKEALRSSRTCVMLPSLNAIAMPPGRHFITSEHNIAFLALLHVKQHVCCEASTTVLKEANLTLGEYIRRDWRFWDRYVEPIQRLTTLLAEFSRHGSIDILTALDLMIEYMWIPSKIDFQQAETYEHKARQECKTLLQEYVAQCRRGTRTASWQDVRTNIASILGKFNLVSPPGVIAAAHDLMPGVHDGSSSHITSMHASAVSSPVLHSGDPPHHFATHSPSLPVEAHPSYYANYGTNGPPDAAPRRADRKTRWGAGGSHDDHAMTMPYMERPRGGRGDRSRSASRGRDDGRSRPSSRQGNGDYGRGGTRDDSRSRPRDDRRSHHGGRDRSRSQSAPRDSPRLPFPPRDAPALRPPPDAPRSAHRPRGEASPARAFTGTDRSCFGCGEKGHMVQHCPLLARAKAASEGRKADPASGKTLSSGGAAAFEAAIDCLETTRQYHGLRPDLPMEDLQAHLNEIGEEGTDFGPARR